jgi:branched-subunit amino acid transport protein
VDTVVVLRFAERMLAVLIGGIAIYLGYRLFLAIPQSTDSEGRFTLPWNTSIFLSRVGPGVFFALFGSIVVGSSLYRSIAYDVALSETHPNERGSAPAAASRSGGRFRGATATPADSDAREDARMRRQRDIAVLNTIPSQLDPRLTPENRNAVAFAIPRIKLALMEAVWNDAWGDPAAFREWAESRDDRVPASLEKAAEYYRYGTRARP